MSNNYKRIRSPILRKPPRYRQQPRRSKKSQFFLKKINRAQISRRRHRVSARKMRRRHDVHAQDLRGPHVVGAIPVRRPHVVGAIPVRGNIHTFLKKIGFSIIIIVIIFWG